MKKSLAILLSFAMLITMVTTMAISVSAADSYDPADYDYAYKLTDHMTGTINYANTASSSTFNADAMNITVDGGQLVKYDSYTSNGYAGYAQWMDSSNNRVLTFDLKNIESGTYKLTVFTCDHNQARGNFDVSANDTSLGVMNCLNTSGKVFTKHAFDTTFTANGTSPVSVVITPTAETTNKQAFLYALALTKTGDNSGEQGSNPTNPSNPTDPSDPTNPSEPTNPSDPSSEPEATSYEYIVYDNMVGSIDKSSYSNDTMGITVDGGVLSKSTNYMTGYNCAQLDSRASNKSVTFDLKGVEAGKYTLTLGTIDMDVQHRGIYGVEVNGSSVGTVDFVYPGQASGNTTKHFVEHAFDPEFSTDGTSDVEVKLIPNALSDERPSNQMFIYKLVLTKTGEYEAPVVDPYENIAGTTNATAQLRIGNFNGIRFITEVNADLVAQAKAEGYTVTMGTLIAPLASGELTLDTNPVLDIPTAGWFANHTGEIAASIVNIKAANITKDFVARGYVKLTKDDTTTVYYATQPNEGRSLKTVAAACVADNSFFSMLNDAQKEQVTTWANAK